MKSLKLALSCVAIVGVSLGCTNNAFKHVATASYNLAVKAANAAIISSGSTVAYVIGFGAYGKLFVYIPGVDRYAYIFPTDGSYSSYDSGGGTLNFSNTNCTGTGVATYYIGLAWQGVMGKTILSTGTSYYLVSGTYTPGTSFPYQSQWTQNLGCVNTSGTYTTVANDAQLTATTQPYNFAAIAPLTITYQ